MVAWLVTDDAQGKADRDRHNGTTAISDASSASRYYGTGNPLEKIAHTGHIGHHRMPLSANITNIWHDAVAVA
ncbi:MAG: hypothetical protein FWC84_06725 [Alphaproteobacteria bacterium]|nr:hypothetical protein [Alphaproteobacteria bacterium]